MGQNPKPIVDNLLKTHSEVGLNILVDFDLLDLASITSSGLFEYPAILNNLKFMLNFFILLMKQCSTLPFFYRQFKEHCQVIKTP